MNSPVPTSLSALTLVGISFATAVGEHVDGVIRVVTLFTVLGTVVAYRRYQRRPGFDPFPVITCWSAVGLVLGVLIELARGLS